MDDNSTKPKMQRNSDVVNFQQESLNYNQLLPYYEEIEANSQQLFQKIKHNLALAVENGELRPGAMHWSIQLDNYIHAYGRRFSKDDHIKLVQLLYKLLTIPDLPPLLVQQFGCVLISLLSKKKLLSRDDLQLEWKPLYRLYHEVYYTNYENNTIRLKKIKSCCKPVIFRLMLATRTYFTASATEEMLQEWRPMMYPFDTSIMLKATSYFCSFLPTALLPHEHNQGFKLWFDELMNLYISCLNSPSWEANLVYLFVRLAKENIGYVHWEPYLAKIFQRILNSFNLPVGKRQVPRSKNAMYKANLCAEWIINMMGDKESKVQFYLNQLLRAIENFCHPSNVGAWVGKIQNFLGSLTSAFIYRLRLERKPKKTWVPKIPKEYHITDDDITTFVENIRPIAMLLLFTKHLSDEVALIIQNLSILRPEIMLPPLLDRTFASLTTLTEPHQVIATMTTLIFYMAAFGLIPIVDCSMLASEEALTEEEKELCSLTARFEDILIQFIDRCFEMIENSSNVESLKSYNTIDGESSFNNEDRQFAEGFYRVFMTILSQSSRTLAMVVIKKLFGFVRGHILGDTIAGHICCAIVSAAANAQPEMTLKLFLPYHSRNILEIIETDDFVDEEQVESGLIWYLLVFSKLMTADGRYIIQYKDHIYKVISMSIHLKSKTASNFTCQGFSSLLESLTAVYPGDRSMANDSPSQYNYLKDWAKCYDRRDVVIDWHKPSEAEMEFAHDLMHDFLIQETNKMQDLTTGPINMKREEIHQCLHIIYCILTGAGEALPPWDKPYLSPLLVYTTLINLKFLRNIYTLYFVGYFLDHVTDDTKSFNLMLSIYDQVLFNYGGQNDHLQEREFLANWWKRLISNKKRRNHIYPCRMTELHQMMISDVLKLSVCDYCEGALFVLTDADTCKFVCHQWENMQQIWPALVKADHSEKSSILILINKVYQQMCREYATLALKYEVPVECREAARALTGTVSVSNKDGDLFLEEMNNCNRRQYMELVNLLLDLCETGDNNMLVFPLENNRFDVKDWKSNTLIDKPYIGYNNVWPRSILTHAALEQQPKVDRGIQEMTEHEAAMYAVLNSHEFIESLIKLYSLEISKDEAFNMHNYAMFKGIFRNFGDSLLPLFERHVENLFADTEHSSSQKCALEIVAGLVRGSKHWGSEKKNRDPKRLRSLFSLLFNENIFAGEQASFLDASALSLIRIFVSDMEWKGYEVQNLALKLVSPWLDHQYKDVRSSLGSLLRDIFKFDVAISKNYVSKGPTATKFIESLLPSLSKLFTEDKRSDGNVELVDPEEKQATLRLSETLLEWLISCNRQNSRTPQPYSIATYKLLPLLIGLENQEDDKDLQILCKLAFGYLAQAQLSDAAVDSVMLALTQVVQSNSWHHRYSMLLFIQVMTFRNLFLLFEHTTATSTIEDILLKLIFDEQIENMRRVFSHEFKLQSFIFGFTILVKKVISRRHSAILGLAACIQAFPYDVPPWLPEILIFIGDRLNDPPPIKTTVKSVVSEFKRTHLDNWEEHKQYFTVDQLSALSDFLISPSYYA
ncbi:uncharacterized protein TRIADDRAFT_51787 [Trichoplax adhaerens]|uniref:Proteasome activator complex subunit 4 C-terminal domain-containing protein n=1 Tax=Trichoplax adhaerens TaxID=10228 RepID=B3RKW2_TRIAD|nr:hypothetical protein TRIADDRAFT_51787 [Trichoplax adhaerens]EDV29443.1 hypothetical protein TRIADDRAFT_51787 [Trichoplax adhaerens]|eukprot:XP_002108645.1 hypothetical protein TRIADDRAFT_51787 [Trichoplax adhaerens]